MGWRSGGAVVLAVGVLAAACSRSSAEPAGSGLQGLIVTQSPADVGRGLLPTSSEGRYPEGSRIVWVPFPPESRGARELTAGFVAAGSPALAPDGDHLLFTAHRRRGEPWGVYELELPAGRPVLRSDGDRSCSMPAYLAHGAIVFACRTGPAATAGSGGAGWDLFTVGPGSVGPTRISFSVRGAFDPAPLRDGRILLALRQAAGQGRPRAGASALFTLNPDGTLLAPLAGSHHGPVRKTRPREGDGGIVYYLADSGDGTPVAVRALDLADPWGSDRALLTLASATSVEPLVGEELVLAGRLEADEESAAVYRWSPGEARPELLFDAPEWDEMEAIPRRARPAPHGRPTIADGGHDRGLLVGYDAGRSDGEIGPPQGRNPAFLRVETLAPEGGVTDLGQVALAADHSFQVEVPADRPLRVLTLDANGSRVAASAWFWVRPGETRACFGCHERRDSAPVNRIVLALERPPQVLGTGSEATR